MAKVTYKINESTSEIRNQLRQIQWDRANHPSSPNKDLPVVVTRRASGKTTGLVYFIGERTLVDSNADLGVIVPTEDIGREFGRRFETSFPTLPAPCILPASRIKFHHGHKFTEVYIEEVFLIKEYDLRDACEIFPVVAGVGTIETPTTITLRV